METLELPPTEELEETLSLPEISPVHFPEQELDAAPFKLWQEASCCSNPPEEDAADSSDRP